MTVEEWVKEQLPQAEFMYTFQRDNGNAEGIGAAFRLGRLEVLQQVEDLLEGREPRPIATTNGDTVS